MRQLPRDPLVAVLALAVFLALHVVFRLAWTGFFSALPWPGYEESTRLGLVEPWFVNSPRSLWLTRVTFFCLAFTVVFVSRRARWRAVAAVWIGASAGIVATWATTATRSIDWGWLGFVLYPFRVLLPIVLGGAIAGLVRRTIPRLRVTQAAPGAGIHPDA